jgi:hypothetical protein
MRKKMVLLTALLLLVLLVLVLTYSRGPHCVGPPPCAPVSTY